MKYKREIFFPLLKNREFGHTRLQKDSDNMLVIQ